MDRKNILVVGAGKGIGLALTQKLSTENNVYTISRTCTSEQVDRSTASFELDVTTSDIDTVNLPDLLHGVVYCPGSILLKPFNRLSTSDFEHDFRQNVLGAVRILQFCLPRLKNSGSSSIVLFSSVAAKVGMPFHASIAASKAALEGFARSISAEYAGANIRCNVISPSLTNTSLASTLINTPDKLEAANKRHPLQRIGTPQEMAELASFLLSDHATWITGQVISVDGGIGSIK